MNVCLDFPPSPIHDELSRLSVDVLYRDEDKYADVPFKTVIAEGGTSATVYAHGQTLNDAHSTYVESGMTPRGIDGVFVSTSVAMAVMRRRFENASIAGVAEYYKPISSTDGLARSILNAIESGGLAEIRGQFLLRALVECDVVTDVAKINALRFAATTAIQQDALTTMQSASVGALDLILGSARDSYEAVLKIFGERSPIRRAQIFANALPEAVIAFAFPMPLAESRQLFELLPK